MKRRNATWDKIASHLNSLGAKLPDYRWLRDREWDYVKKATSKKIQGNGSTGAAPQAYTDLDEVIIDVLGRDSANVNGIDVEDMEISFDRPASNVDPRQSSFSRSANAAKQSTSLLDRTLPSLGKSLQTYK